MTRKYAFFSIHSSVCIRTMLHSIKIASYIPKKNIRLRYRTYLVRFMTDAWHLKLRCHSFMGGNQETAKTGDELLLSNGFFTKCDYCVQLISKSLAYHIKILSVLFKRAGRAEKYKAMSYRKPQLSQLFNNKAIHNILLHYITDINKYFSLLLSVATFNRTVDEKGSRVSVAKWTFVRNGHFWLLVDP